MLERSPIVRERTYHVLCSEKCVFCTRLYESTFILKRKYIKWNATSLCVAYLEFTGEFTFSEELKAHTETKELRSISSRDFYVFHLANFTHTQSLKLCCAPAARAYHILWFGIAFTLQSQKRCSLTLKRKNYALFDHAVPCTRRV